MPHDSFSLGNIPKIGAILLGLAGGIGIAVGLVIGLTPGVLRGLAAAVVAAPLVEYGIHRFISHGSVMYKTKATAAIWKRIHYDHHQNPANPIVLLGTPQHVIFGSLLFSVPIGLIAGGVAGAAAAIPVGLFHAGVVEIIHANSHVPVLPNWNYLRYLKRLHLLHHFRNERVNFGVTSPVFDMLFRTYHSGEGSRRLSRSASVRNLGYGAAEAERYPWLAKLNRKQSPFGAKPGMETSGNSSGASFSRTEVSARE